MRKNAIFLGASFLIAKLLGLLRDNLLASNFGASAGNGIYNLDAYYAAFRLPDLIYNLLSFGVLSAAFVPIFIEILKKENREAALKFANETIAAFGLTISVISAAIAIAAPLIIKIFVPGFDEEARRITVIATRIMLITPLIFTVSAVASGMLNAFGRFTALALAPVLYNIGIITGIVFLAPNYGVYGVSIGVACGALLHLALQFIAAIRAGFHFSKIPQIFSIRVKEAIALSIPRIIGMSVSQIALVISTIIASTLATGSIAVLNFAVNLHGLPLGLIGISVAIVSFGTLSSHAAEGKMQEFSDEISTNLHGILYLLIPLALGMAALRFQIVSLILGRGKFIAADISATADTLGLLLAGLCFGGIVFLLARAFYAMKDTLTPVKISIAAIIINIALSILFARTLNMGTYGLALAISIADIFNASFLIFFLRKKLNMRLIEWKKLIKCLAAALVMFAAMIIARDKLEAQALIVQSILATLLGAGVYFGAIRLLRYNPKR